MRLILSLIRHDVLRQQEAGSVHLRYIAGIFACLVAQYRSVLMAYRKGLEFFERGPRYYWPGILYNSPDPPISDPNKHHLQAKQHIIQRP